MTTEGQRLVQVTIAVKSKIYPDIPMTMAGTDEPLLTMHQLLPSARSKASSNNSCLKIGTPCNLSSFTARFDDIAVISAGT